MKHTDQLIRYISGEMEGKEKAELERMISLDPELKNAYLQIKQIWEIAEAELSLEGLSGEETKEELIAAVIAEHDIHYYGDRSPSSREQTFKKTIRQVNEANAPPGREQKKMIRMNIRNGLILAAATVLLFVLVRPVPGPGAVAERYYEPADIHLLNGQATQTRSDTSMAVRFFKDEDFRATRYLIEKKGNLKSEKPAIRLIYAISLYETSDTTGAVLMLEHLSRSAPYPVSREATWYVSLILIKAERSGEALPYLQKLTEQKGRYLKESRKLLRRINKEI